LEKENKEEKEKEKKSSASAAAELAQRFPRPSAPLVFSPSRGPTRGAARAPLPSLFYIWPTDGTLSSSR